MKTRTNVQMVDLCVLRKRVSIRDERIKELEKFLNRTVREIETLQAQLDCNQSDGLIERCREVLEDKLREVY